MDDEDSNRSDRSGDGVDAVEVCETGKKRPIGAVFGQCIFTVIFSVTASFLFSFLFGLAAIALGALSNSSAVLVPAECKILSSGVDLRSSKHCGFTLSNYRDMGLFYRLEKARVQCRDDYYWASVFKVEYKDFLSGRNVNAVAEVPREALPDDCRPSFNAVWSIKSMFKVNETYKCRYAPGTHRADIYSDEIFNCRPNEPSNMEMAMKSLIVLLRSVTSFSVSKANDGHPMLGMVVGIVTGMLISICLSIMMRIVYMLKLSLSRRVFTRENLAYFAFHIRRGCLVVAYISAMGWLTMQYSKMIGLKQLLLSSDLRERLAVR